MKRFIGSLSLAAVIFGGLVVASGEDAYSRAADSRIAGEAKDRTVVREQRSETIVLVPVSRRPLRTKRFVYRSLMSPVKLPWAPNAPGD